MRANPVLALAFIGLFVMACGETPPTADGKRGGASLPRGLGKADGWLSCGGVCGEQAPGGCWCDELCSTYGDCCADKVSVCDTAAPEPSCQQACGGKSKEGCWCDELCATYGDCCADKEQRCDGGPLSDCKVKADCDSGLTCTGVPYDGSTPWGRCVASTSAPGEGESCSPSRPCSGTLLCVGLELFGEGSCSPAWMSGSWVDAEGAALPDATSAAAGVLERSQVVYGLATVPVEIVVELDIAHARPADLRITLVDPNGVEGLVADGAAGPLPTRALVSGIPGDDSVNGRWTLRVADRASGKTGDLKSWTLQLTSRWD